MVRKHRNISRESSKTRAYIYNCSSKIYFSENEKQEQFVKLSHDKPCKHAAAHFLHITII